MKILLILSDGTRPDSLEGIEFIEKLKRESTYCMAAQTVMPSVTLPCHMSLFHSVDPSRHHHQHLCAAGAPDFRAV